MSGHQMRYRPHAGKTLVHALLIISALALSSTVRGNADAANTQHNAYLMTAPNASTGNVSTLHIINTSSQSQSFYGSLYNNSGQRIGNEKTTLVENVAPYARATITSEQVSDKFGDTWSGPALLEVYGEASFSPMIRLSSPSGLVSNTNCVTEDVVHNLDGFDSSDRPFVRFINTTDAALTNVTATLYNASGAVVGTANQVLIDSLAAKEQKFLNREELGNLFNEQWDGTASLYIADKTGLKLILVNFIVSQSTFFNFSCFDGNDDLTNPVTESSGSGGSQVTDITNAIFTRTSADCASYAENYSSSVTDVKRSVAFTGSVSIASNSSSCTITTNAIPNHNFNDTGNFATDVSEVDRTFTVSRSPATAITTTALTQARYDAIMLNGVVLDLLSAGCYKPNDPSADNSGNTSIGCNSSDDWLLDPLGTDHKFGADSFNAHTQPDGTYHYHGNPNAMFNDSPGANGSPVIGFAADGFPIYGSYFLDPDTNTVRKAVSGYTLKSGSRGTKSDTNPGGTYDGTYIDDYEHTSAGDLDTCNGMTLNGQYAYYVTDAYPWVMNCHNGTPDNSFSKN